MRQGGSLVGGQFDRFLSRHTSQGAVGCARSEVEVAFPSSTLGVTELFSRYGGPQFSNGMYRLHRIAEGKKGTDMVGEAFPEFRARIRCFGCDWLGREFALDSARLRNGMPLVLMLEPGTGEALEIPA